MDNSNNNSKMTSKPTQIIIISVVSLILTIPSMAIIKHLPGNKFSSEIEFVATCLLVFGLWFLVITACIRLVRYRTNLRELAKNPSDKRIEAAVMKEKKGFKYLEKTFILVSLAAGVGFLIMIIAMIIIFAGAARR